MEGARLNLADVIYFGEMSKEAKWIFWGLSAVLLVFGFVTKNYLGLIYFPVGVMVGVLISKPRPGRM